MVLSYFQSCFFSNDLYISVESGETNIFVTEMFIASKLSSKFGHIFGTPSISLSFSPELLSVLLKFQTWRLDKY